MIENNKYTLLSFINKENYVLSYKMSALTNGD